MSGTLREKLEAIAAARFDGYELFENDLLYFNGSAAEVGALSTDLGLMCELYQPFRDFEGAPDPVFRRNLERAERKFDVMAQLGARLMLVCSNTSPNVIADEERTTAKSQEPVGWFAQQARQRRRLETAWTLAGIYRGLAGKSDLKRRHRHHALGYRRLARPEFQRHGHHRGAAGRAGIGGRAGSTGRLARTATADPTTR